MAGYRSHDPRDRAEARKASLLEEKRIIAGIEHDINLPHAERSKLPGRRQYLLDQYIHEGRLK